jgi:hypothetical protein
MENFTGPNAWTDPFVRHKQWKDGRFGEEERKEPIKHRVTDVNTKDKVTESGEDYKTGSILICIPLCQI